MRHHSFKELFTGRRNIFTVTLTLIGGYFIAYPLVNITLKHFSYGTTIAIGLVLLVLGDYLMDAFHKSKKGE